MALRLVVGLGNPGAEYEKTRHNVGFLVADRLAGSEDWKDADLGLWTKVGSLFIAKPMTYMNESGRFVQWFGNYYKIPASEMLIVYDDIALPEGRLRIRLTGSAGGQKGMKSIIEKMGTQDIPRLRVGLGPQPSFMDSAAFVLQRYRIPEEVIERASEAALAADDLAAAMNKYNPKE